MSHVPQNIMAMPSTDIQKLVESALKELVLDDKSYVKYAVSLTNVDKKHIEWKYNFFGKQVRFFKNYHNAPTAKKLYEHFKNVGFQDGGVDELDSGLLTTLFVYFNQS